ncbi:MAG: flagellar basal body P-ring protein FlgI [Candidatus Omnitrophota bacterium]
MNTLRRTIGLAKSGIRRAVSSGCVLTALLLWLAAAFEAQGQPIVSRIKDIAELDGVQENVLIGYGLVAGLNGTGDGRRGFTAQSLNNMIAGMGINVVPPETITTEIVPDNVAAVLVMSSLPPFARPGTKIDATVFTIGRAESLQGGTLFPTPLKGADGQFHGMAYGPLSIGGFRAAAGGGGAGAAGGASIQENHPVVGRIANGVMVEGEPVFQEVLQQGNSLRWLLYQPDFKTASNVQRKINSMASANIAVAEDAGAVRVDLNADAEGHILLGNQSFDSLVDAIAFIDDALVETDKKAKIVINERTGTIVAGHDIRVHNVVISHGSLRITIQNVPDVTALGFGQGMQTLQPTVSAQQGANQIAIIQGTTLGDVVSQLNALGYTPRDLIAILQAMAAQGAIKAEIEII